MKSSLVSLLTVALCAVGALAQDNGFQVNTPPSGLTCTPLKITWTAGQPPFIPSIHNGADPSGTPIVQFNSTTDNFVTWVVNVPQGSYGINVVDNTGQTVQSAAFPIVNGQSTACVGQPLSTPGGGGSTSASSGSSSTGAGTTSAVVPPPTSAGSTTAITTGSATTAASTSTKPASSSSGSKTSSAAGGSQTSNAASSKYVQAGAAGMVGAAVLAILA